MPSANKEIDEKSRYVLNIGIENLTEATINKDERTVEVTALQSGWSKNGNYYSRDIAESLTEHLLAKRKVYLNHQLRPLGNKNELSFFRLGIKRFLSACISANLRPV